MKCPVNLMLPLAALVLAGCQTPEVASPPASVPPFTGIKLVHVPPGEFIMGSASGAPDERPPRKVSITRGFWISEAEITKAEFLAVMGADGYRAHMGTYPKTELLNHPIDSVNYYNAMEFCRTLSEKTGVKYTLPTEAQWEYACRAGTTGRFSFGDLDADLDAHAWHRGNSSYKTHPVKTTQPNPWGLYDMHGNVLEWCLDWYDKDFYAQGPAVDPLNTTFGSEAFGVVRGGGATSSGAFCRSACRFKVNREMHPLFSKGPFHGLRVVTTDLPPPKAP